MKKITLTASLAVLLHFCTWAQSSDDPQEFKSFFQTYLKSYNLNAAETLRNGAVSDYQMLGGDGVWRNLHATCQIFEGAKTVYYRVSDEKYRVYGTTGVVTGTAFWGYDHPQNGKYDGRALLTYVFTKTPTGWKQVSGHHIDLK